MKGSKQDGTLVVYNGQIYKGIEEIGFNHRDSFVLDLWTTDPADMRGGFFASIPISSVEYRRTRPTKCGYRQNGETLSLFDDGGVRYLIKTNLSVIETLVQECIANEIPEV